MKGEIVNKIGMRNIDIKNGNLKGMHYIDFELIEVCKFNIFIND